MFDRICYGDKKKICVATDVDEFIEVEILQEPKGRLFLKRGCYVVRVDEEEYTECVGSIKELVSSLEEKGVIRRKHSIYSYSKNPSVYVASSDKGVFVYTPLGGFVKVSDNGAISKVLVARELCKYANSVNDISLKLLFRAICREHYNLIPVSPYNFL